MASVPSSRARLDGSVVLIWACFLAIAVVVLLAPGVYDEGYTHDIFVVLENGSRAFAGQVQSKVASALRSSGSDSA